ncbi:hypothetical protein [Azospirillum griseum]|uniref:hypothetical protein n=1 Tax=Azospirillum griseum TaxID=2496639 RepID=UPI0013150752|nr:hypothetical protein [Azospirillum griseum]
MALGANVAFFDLAIALAAPGGGALAGLWGYDAVFLAGAAALSMLLIATDRRA